MAGREEALKKLESPNWRYRLEAVAELEKLNDKDTIGALTKLLFDDPSMPVKLNIARALKAMGGIPFEILERKIAELGSQSWQIKTSAIEVLGILGDSRVLVPILNALNDSNDYVRNASFKAVAEIGDIRAIPTLHQLKLSGGQYPSDASPEWAIREISLKNPLEGKCRICRKAIIVSDINNEFISQNELQAFADAYSRKKNLNSVEIKKGGFICRNCLQKVKDINKDDNYEVNISQENPEGSQSRLEYYAFNKGAISCIKISPDGKKAFLASSDGSISAVDFSGGNIDHFGAHNKKVNALAISSSSQYLVSGGDDSTIHIYDLASGSILRVFKKYAPPITSLSITNDCSKIVSAQGTSVYLISFDELQEIKKVKSTNEVHHSVNVVRFSPDDRYIASGSNGCLWLWDNNLNFIKSFEVNSDGIRALAFSPDSKYIISEGADYKICVRDITSGICIQYLTGHSKRITSLEMSADGKILVSGSVDKTVRVWDTTSWICLQSFAGHKGPVNAIAINNKTNEILSGGGDFFGGNDYSIRIWDFSKFIVPPAKNSLQPPPGIKSEKISTKPEITIDLGDGIKIEMVLIPAGKFMMGSPDNEHKKDEFLEGPVHAVTISKDFYIGKYPVTQGQWQKVMGNNPSKFKKGDKYPVETVSWNDCQEFIKKINDRRGEWHSPNDGGTLRLPTEAEWEYACRAGSAKAYYWGREMDGAYCWYDENSGDATHPVGEKKPNAWGLYDMIGNVSEWCQDFCGIYSSSPVTDPSGPAEGSNRIRRGSWFLNSAYNSRSAIRDGIGPRTSCYFLGFRLAFSPGKPGEASTSERGAARSAKHEANEIIALKASEEGVESRPITK